MPSILICSVSPESYRFPRSYNWGGLVIPACPKDKPFTSLLITDQMDDKVTQTDHWVEHAIHTPFPVTAESVVKDLFSCSDKIGANGCFVPKGELPTEEEVTNARLTRRNYLLELVNIGQGEYSRTGRIDTIAGNCKRAAAELGMDLEWAKQMPTEKPAMMECPACGEVIKPGVAICKTCHAILNVEKARQYGLVEDEEPVKKEKPPKVI